MALAAYEVGKTEAEVMGEAERVFSAGGTWRTTMDMVLTGPDGSSGPEFKHPSATRRIGKDDLLLYGLEISAHGGHLVEFSRPFCAGTPSKVTLDAMEVEVKAAAGGTVQAGSTLTLKGALVNIN